MICDSSLVKTLSMIFKNCVCLCEFPGIWKKSNICPIHEKTIQYILNNYRPVSLLPIRGKLFERIIFDSLYNYLEDSKLLTVCQSGFQCNDPCVK